ncbi:unnamed protein product [Pleuronectes platessa]|uniref:Uncharacterized protein n=1 Tax=Pleuronectes platessa TaxID=8262 RepID=A0A9N7UZ19_PLEPL|nr:unnamed protein product [Pleuronectes platessa]
MRVRPRKPLLKIDWRPIRQTESVSSSTHAAHDTVSAAEGMSGAPSGPGGVSSLRSHPSVHSLQRKEEEVGGVGGEETEPVQIHYGNHLEDSDKGGAGVKWRKWDTSTGRGLSLDTEAERNALKEHVYPKLRDFCRENYGIEFQPIASSACPPPSPPPPTHQTSARSSLQIPLRSSPCWLDTHPALLTAPSF